MALVDEIERILDEFGTSIKEDLQQSLRDKGVDYGGQDSKLSDKIQFYFEPKQGSVVFKLAMPEYGEAVDKGRGKNKTPPPIAPIISWIKRKGLKPTASEKRTERIKSIKDPGERKATKIANREQMVKGMAIAISRKIGREGFEGNNFFSEVAEDGRITKLKQDLAAVLKTEVQIEIINLTKI